MKGETFKPKNNQYLVKILSGRRIAIPQEWLEKVNLGKGDWIGLEEDPFSERLDIIPLDIKAKTEEEKK